MTRYHADTEADQSALLRQALVRYQPLIEGLDADQPGDLGANPDESPQCQWQRQRGGGHNDHWDRFIAALQRPLPGCIWAHPQRLDAPELVRLISAEEGSELPGLAALPWNPKGLRLPAGYKAGRRWWYCAGLAHAQEEASQLPVQLMDLRPGQRVLDLCAAPGGKTAQIGLALGNQGTVLANDFARERIAALQGNLDRLGLVNVSTTWCDGGNYPAAAGGFDRILVDAPCSSEGTLRRNRSLAERLDPDSVAGNRRLHGRQLALLRKAVQLCRAGGRIVYSTCTFAPEENECIIARVLEEQAGRLRLLPVRVPGLATSPGVVTWGGQRLDASLAHCVRLWPQLTDTGGFFVAVLEKAQDAPECEPADGARIASAVDDAGWLPALAEHYGWPEAIWQNLCAHRQTRRGLHLLAADHRPPSEPAAQGRGLFFLRTNIRPPKLTTAGALLLGRQATRQFIELDREQRDAYLGRRSVTPRAAQCADCRPGQVMVRYLGHGLGVALLTRSGTLDSLFPSRWSANL